MISAFGIDHGYDEVSKGLPSALRNANKFPSGPNNYVNTRLAAHAQGRSAAKEPTRNIPKAVRRRHPKSLPGQASTIGQTNRAASRSFLP